MFKRMTNSPAYLWYPKDIISSGRVAALSALEELWYRRALDQSWLHEGLPRNPAEFAGWVGRECTVAAARKIIRKFFEPYKKDPTKVVNPRQEEERRKFVKKSKERSKAGIESGRKRRERSQLEAEQLLNKPGTKSNIPIPISFPISSSDFKRLIEELARVNPGRDERLIEIAVIQTLVNRNGAAEPIKSFSYFTPEIERVSAAPVGSQTLDVVLQSRRKQFEKWRKAA